MQGVVCCVPGNPFELSRGLTGEGDWSGTKGKEEWGLLVGWLDGWSNKWQDRRRNRFRLIRGLRWRRREISNTKKSLIFHLNAHMMSCLPLPLPFLSFLLLLERERESICFVEVLRESHEQFVRKLSTILSRIVSYCLPTKYARKSWYFNSNKTSISCLP